jgi:tryptophan synthase beta chain
MIVPTSARSSRGGDGVPVPTHWRSALPHLKHPLPPDISPDGDGSGGALKINLPLELVRQSVQAREFWPIPEEVVDAYRRYRPTPLWRADRLERALDSAVPIYVKYEGGNISGSHKLNTALAQAYYYKRAGVREVVTGTGAGQWGTALAAACALFGLRCTVFMVDTSMARKPYRSVLMRLLGAEVVASPSTLTRIGSETTAASANSLSLAIGEAVEYATAHDDIAFCIGSGETYSILHQSVIGVEAGEQLTALGADVDAVVACVGAGSNFGGLALPFYCEAAAGGVAPPRLIAAESSSTPKLSRGVYAYDKTDATGLGPLEAMYTIGSDYAIPDEHAAGLRYHGAAKLISALRHAGEIEAAAVSQAYALRCGAALAVTESVLAAPESGHALAAVAELVAGRIGDAAPRRGVLVCVSGHGYLDLGAYDEASNTALPDLAPDDDALSAALSGLTRMPADGSALPTHELTLP